MKTEFAHLARFIEIKNKKRIRQLKAGLFATNQKGWAIGDFKDIRQYTPEDDTRLIDWNVTSRLNDVFVKEFYDEQELNVNVFLDASESMNLAGLLPGTKYYYGFQFALLLALVFTGSSDRFRIILYSDKIQRISGVLKTKSSVFAEMKQIFEKKREGGTNHFLPLAILKEKYPKRSLSYIISDFSNLPDMSLYRQLHKQHELAAIRILDGSEKILPNILNQFYLSGAEGGDAQNFNSIRESDTNFLKSFYNFKYLDLEPGKTGTGSIMEFFNL